MNLSTKDMTYGPSIIPTIHFEPPKEENLSTKNKSAEFMSSPKSPLFGGSSVVEHLCVDVRMVWHVLEVSFIRRFHCVILQASISSPHSCSVNACLQRTTAF